MPEHSTIVYCRCAYSDVVPAEVKQEVLRALRASGVAFEAVADLCELSARRDPAMKRIARAGAVKIAACYPRAVKWLFAAAGAALPGEGVEVLNMRVGSAEEIVRSLLGGGEGTGPGREAPSDAPARGEKAGESPLEAPEWIPWFPVIDYDRCRNCKQCMSFCLFGVYEASADETVKVVNPANCKTNCPACARICPEVAIIFPKYKAGPINGDEVRAEDLRRQNVKVDVASLLKGDVYETLRNRGKDARSPQAGEMDEQKALAEREKCSQASAGAGAVVPLEAFLSSLTIEEIRAEAEKTTAAEQEDQEASDEQPEPEDEPADDRD